MGRIEALLIHFAGETLKPPQRSARLFLGVCLLSRISTACKKSRVCHVPNCPPADQRPHGQLNEHSAVNL